MRNVYTTRRDFMSFDPRKWHKQRQLRKMEKDLFPKLTAVQQQVNEASKERQSTLSNRFFYKEVVWNWTNLVAGGVGLLGILASGLAFEDFAYSVCAILSLLLLFTAQTTDVHRLTGEEMEECRQAFEAEYTRYYRELKEAGFDPGKKPEGETVKKCTETRLAHLFNN